MSDGEYNPELCDEKHKNIWTAITALQTDKKDFEAKIEKKIGFFNLTGIGILVSILTGLILRYYGG